MDSFTAFLWLAFIVPAAHAVVNLVMCAIEAPAIFAAIRRAKAEKDSGGANVAR